MSPATRATVASSAASTTVDGYASSPPSLKTVPTSKALASLVRSRAVRIASAVVFVLAIVSPAAVVFAVVWTAPTVSAPGPASNVEPARLLPAPDFQQAPLPVGPLNVYANTISGGVPCPLCKLPRRVYVPNTTPFPAHTHPTPHTTRT